MKIIDKSTFNKLSIKNQVNVFNNLLKEFKNIKEVCKVIGISYSTIRDRFHKHNYTFNKFSNEYEGKDNYIENTNELENVIEKVILDMNKKEINPLINYDKSKYNDKVVLRSFRIHENVLDNFVEYCENSNLKQYDVISLFIHEGLQKYQ